MTLRRRRLLSLAPLALLAVGACATPFRADVSRFQQLPVPQGQSFAIEALDPDKRGGLEFAQYADLVAYELERIGYREAPPGARPEIVVAIDYDVDNGRERVVSTPGWSGWGPGYGFGSYWGRRSRFGYYRGWHDPFLFGPGWNNDVRSYTVYSSTLDMQIERSGNGERLFEGTARAVSRSDDLPYLVPNLVAAMFEDFPGNSGETVRISVPPPENR